MSKSISVETFVDIDLEDIDTEDLIEELEDRGHKLSGVAESLIWSIYEKRTLGEDITRLRDELKSRAFDTAGKVKDTKLAEVVWKLNSCLGKGYPRRDTKAVKEQK